MARLVLLEYGNTSAGVRRHRFTEPVWDLVTIDRYLPREVDDGLEGHIAAPQPGLDLLARHGPDSLHSGNTARRAVKRLS